MVKPRAYGWALGVDDEIFFFVVLTSATTICYDDTFNFKFFKPTELFQIIYFDYISIIWSLLLLFPNKKSEKLPDY